MQTSRSLALAAGAALICIAACATSGAGRTASSAGAAFADVAKVLRHPRCMNCHPSGDRPRVGDQRRLHPQNVMRGPANHGMPAMHCATCHRPENLDHAGVPGAPSWHLAPRSMGWEGLDDRALAEALKDPAKNGGRSLDDMIEHLERDPLVGWGWAPGAGREPIPLPRAAFVEAFRSWVRLGAELPPAGTTTTF